MSRYAVISDIHGNVWALDAVLKDISRRGVRHIINLGDTVYGPLEPQEAAERLMEPPLVSIQGNEDRILFGESELPASPTCEYVRKSLTRESLEWLAAQPATAVVAGELFLCHGTPTSDEAYLLERLSPQGAILDDPASIEARLASVTPSVILCGHSHVPRTVRLSDGRLIVNPGSVGLQAYADDAPVAHTMETGSPHARYAVLAQTSTGWSVEQIILPYEWRKAADAARRNGRSDWAVWIESGRA